MNAPAVVVEDLAVRTVSGAEVVSGVNLVVQAGRMVGLLGETGAGKTVTARAMLGLLPRGLKAAGRVRFGRGQWLDLSKPDTVVPLLGRMAGLMLQDPASAFDPVQRIGPQLVESVVRNRLMSKPEAVARAEELCAKLSLPEPASLFRLFPHELSGGMSQRVALAMTLMPAPELLVVDEPTSALDANLRVDALRLLRDIAGDGNTGMLLISHDLALVSHFCDEIGILYAGHLAELGPTSTVLRKPAHPYTRTLVSCSLRLNSSNRVLLPTVGGEPPLPGDWPSGCYFHPRCPAAREKCRDQTPVYVTAGARGAACHFADLED
ncbi:ABC transporter ATP-binding protein [Amycolatopsis thermoflava]|uniref:ABC transporter ATP-binding protein n=1 Tax=Amycolatopsis thermoflava TaxID=84480 RepID=UPI0003F94568|nr:ABC transporter ATP-binding protein [Amycolatopsis thermoflava]